MTRISHVDVTDVTVAPTMPNTLLNAVLTRTCSTSALDCVQPHRT